MTNNAYRNNDCTKCGWWQTMLLSVIMLHASLIASSQGVPVIRNFLPQDYKANNFNFDIETASDGTVYVANFEGLMYYDKAEWRLIRTPDITRVTVVFRDSKDSIWVGGYNYFGCVAKKANGELYLKRIGKPNEFRGEVVEIVEDKGEINFFVNNGNLYQIKDNHLAVKKKFNSDPHIGLTDVIRSDALKNEEKIVLQTDTIVTVSLEYGMKASAISGKGLYILNDKGVEINHISEDNGLCSNEIVWMSYDGHGTLWGATSEGLFAVAIPSIYSHFSTHEGLTGDILAIQEFDGRMYVGTLDGLFRQEGKKFVRVPGINHGCWDLAPSANGLLAATSNGVYRIAADKATQLTVNSSMAVYSFNDHYFSGEDNGLYMHNPATHISKMVSDLEKVRKIINDSEGTIWLQNLYGDVCYMKAGETTFKRYSQQAKEETAYTIMLIDGKVVTINAVADEPFPYPLFSYTDPSGMLWLTDNAGKSLYRWKDGQRQEDMEKILRPHHDMTVRAMLCKNDEIWIGGDNGLWVIDRSKTDPLLDTKPHLYIRSVRLRGDSVLWGGYGKMPDPLPELDSKERNLHFTYALDYVPLVGKTLYRYKLNDGNWSAWEEDNKAEFLNLHYGSYTFTVQALMATGELSEETSINFSIRYPFYMRWYMNILYLLLLLGLVYMIIQWRLRKLERDKIMLENIVQERTAEVVQQKDEIEEKSKSLEHALKELGEAQHELIRQEKMATVGKLTQGLIDRILNPLNYINNFSKLSEGLVKDVKANVEDEKEHMDEENYEDTMDVLDMLSGNLQKVGEHGQNTTRTLKAMEEMLKDRSGGIVKTDITNVLRQNEEMVGTYYANLIADNHIQTIFTYPDSGLIVKANPELLSKTIMSLLGNAVYAVVKKVQHAAAANEAYQPEVTLHARLEDTQIVITIHDNGTGISENIISKIFDPFFTTKTTAEASGTGLYLSRETVQNYGGDITAKSVKNEYSEFTITLPAIKE